MSDADRAESPSGTAVILDFLPHGRADDDRPGYQKSPLAYALRTDTFRLYEIIAAEDADIRIGDEIDVDPSNPAIERRREIGYDDLPSGAQSELEYVINDLIDSESDRFIDIYNEAQPITLRLHQLNLLPGIGKKLRNSILDERKRQPFEDFEDLESRVPGLHDPNQILADRIMEELREQDLKYRLFVRRDGEE